MAPQLAEGRHVLRRNHVQKFGAGGNAHLGEVDEQVAGQPQAIVNFEGLVEVRIVEQALPADGGAGLFEINAHDDEKIAREFGNRALQQTRIFASGFGVVNRTGADDDEQAMVITGGECR